LVKLHLFRRTQEEGGSVYWRTTKLKELCPEILRVQIPSIDRLVEEYDKGHQQQQVQEEQEDQ
jgi:hypothetical protein